MINHHTYQVLRSASEIAYPGFGSWLYDTWASLNHDYFDGELQAIAIIWGRIGRTCRLSQYEPGLMRITLHTTLLSPFTGNGNRFRVLNERLARDTLLHAMMHQAIYQRLGHDGSVRARQTIHHTPAWIEEVKRIAPRLKHSLPASWILSQEKLDRQMLAEWPYATRPAGFYAKGARTLL